MWKNLPGGWERSREIPHCGATWHVRWRLTFHASHWMRLVKAWFAPWNLYSPVRSKHDDYATRFLQIKQEIRGQCFFWPIPGPLAQTFGAMCGQRIDPVNLL